MTVIDPAQTSPATLAALEASLLNTSGNVALHNRFRALFTLKALKTDDAVRIISKGQTYGIKPAATILLIFGSFAQTGFQDESALLKHELAYCLGQMKNRTALPVLESILTNEDEDPMVRHEVCLFASANLSSSIHLSVSRYDC